MSATNPYPQFLLLGDSLIQYSSRLHPQNDTEGKPVALANGRTFSFGAALAERTERCVDVVNRGFSGYNTSNILRILERLIPVPEVARVEVLLLLLGANDACLPTSSTNQHIPLTEYRQNLKKIITHPAIQKQNPKILLVTPPPVHEAHLEAEDLRKGNGALTREQKVTREYAQVVRDVAEELDGEGREVVLVDLWRDVMDDVRAKTEPRSESESNSESKIEGGGDKEALLGELSQGPNKRFYELLVDGLHMSGEGYRIFFDAVIKALGGKWGEGGVDSEAWVFPKWDDAPRMEEGS
ncbi:hypothetical protein HYFRA_00013998 [Hymenoscyphus fraxineus]|uniref:SGNH hydrolase-type esterase domain-containing protein n=1 Tax=Hymenoscyphus fraxineus TaxID=746836 RepID=A0A9N9Q1J1_9HELO|nr:hypothetical protein HYFRA_00013998 [Hymenoscyphus fraxineus]